MEHQYISTTTLDSSVCYDIDHPCFTARISQFGGQLLSYIPKGKNEIIWLSNKAKLDGSKPIRGGAPICWPWFGPAKNEHKDEPQHGYVRNLNWNITHTTVNQQSMDIILSPQIPNALKHKISLTVELKITFSFETSTPVGSSNACSIELTTINSTDKPQGLSQAIHTYFSIESISNCRITGLNDVNYIDKLDNQVVKNQQGDILITEHTDRIYITDLSSVDLQSQNMAVQISGKGHDSIVIWNPWVDNAKAMPDFDDEGYKHMICVEMANTQNLTLQPGQTHSLVQSITPSSFFSA